MNANQEAKLAMCKVVAQHSDDNAAIIGTVAAFQTATADFKAAIAAIDAAETVTLTPGQAQTISVGAFTATRHCRFTFRLVVATSDGSFTLNASATRPCCVGGVQPGCMPAMMADTGV